VTADTPATVLCDGDAGLWRLQREVLPGATPVLCPSSNALGQSGLLANGGSGSSGW
jgi:hypothetical protein